MFNSLTLSHVHSTRMRGTAHDPLLLRILSQVLAALSITACQLCTKRKRHYSSTEIIHVCIESLIQFYIIKT